jgi:hypothetical protein
MTKCCSTYFFGNTSWYDFNVLIHVITTRIQITYVGMMMMTMIAMMMMMMIMIIMITMMMVMMIIMTMKEMMNLVTHQ